MPPPNANLQVMLDDPEGESVDLKFFARREGLGGGTANQEPFTVVVLPDTQNYVRNSAWPHVMQTQIDWILENREADNTAFVSHVGDVVSNAEIATEWDLAEDILDDLDGVLPYAISPGNHDQALHIPEGTETLYTDYYPPSRFEGFSWYGGNFPPGTNWNNYQLISAGGRDFIFVHIQFCPSAEELSWASTVLAAHPTRFGIVTTHGYTDKFGNRGVNLCPDTQYIWDDLVVPSNNVYLLLCGHMRSESVRSDFVGEREVHQVMANYQDEVRGGDGWLRILRFVPAEDRIDFTTYSTWHDEFRTDSTSQFSLSVPLQSFSRIGELTGVASGTSVSMPYLELDGNTTYEWFVTATDPNGGQIRSPTWTFTTTAGKPTATIVAVSPDPAKEGFPVVFDGTAADPGGTIEAYEWASDLAGVLSTEEDFSTMSLSPGTHVISFRARDNDSLWSDVASRELFVEETITPTAPPGGFRRGDPNIDGSGDLSDGIYTLNFLFADGETPPCIDAADTDDSGEVDISDPISLFSFLFLGGVDPPLPGPHDCGTDPTEDALVCEQYGVCE